MVNYWKPMDVTLSKIIASTCLYGATYKY